MRTDGAYVEAGEQDNLIVQKLQEDKDAYGLFGFSYLDQTAIHYKVPWLMAHQQILI